MKSPIFLDFETRSYLNLKEYGTDVYAHHPSTEILSIAWLDGTQMNVYLPPFAPDTVSVPEGVKVTRALPTFDPDRLYIAHNALGFDAIIMARFFGITPSWFDTMLSAKIAGKPGGLAKLGQKEDDSSLRILTQPKNGRFIVGNSVLWKKLIEYNIQDVITLFHIYKEYQSYYESELIQIHYKINSRGIPINTEWASKLVMAYEMYKAEQQEEISYLTSINPRSPAQVKQLLEQNGFKVESLQQKYLKDFYLNPDGYKVTPVDHGREVFSDERILFRILEQRREISRALGGKIARVLVMQRQGRVRHCLNHYGAHTGRWSGRGFQPHNFMKPIEHDNFQAEKLIACQDAKSLLDECKKQADSCKKPVSDIISSLQRTIIQAEKGNTFLIGDYSAVELCGTAWTVQETHLLRLLREKADPYQDFADKLDISRWLAKQIILGCTYGMSAQTFETFCLLNGVDLKALGFDSVFLVQSFRDTYQEISGFWRKINRLTIQVVQTGRGIEINGIRIYMQGQVLCIELQSGRTLYYHGAFIQDVMTNWGTLQPVVHYTHHHGGIRKLWGGLILENIVQGGCRDILATGLVANESDKIPICFHVHDEIIAEVPVRQAKKLLPRFENNMKAAGRTWAKGFPINVKCYISPVYFKSPLQKPKVSKKLVDR